MNRKLASILALALCLSSCGSAETGTPSQAEATTTAVDSQQYEDLIIDDIIYPAEVKPEITYKGTGFYSLSINEKWKIHMNEIPKDDGTDILYDTEEDEARLYFLMNVSSEPDIDTLLSTQVDTTKSSENGYSIYVFKYHGTTGYTAYRKLGESKYILSVDDLISDIPSEEEFKEFIGKLKIAP